MKKYILIITTILFFFFGFSCSQKEPQPPPESEQPKTEKQAEPQAEEKETKEVEKEKKQAIEEQETEEPGPMEIFKINYASLPTEHTVVRGECLWWIAEYKEIYNDPFMWPLIYRANKDKIDEPDLIYPGQVFSIPRQFELEELKDSRKNAGAPQPHLPPKEANIPAELRTELGWGF